jgi:flagellar motility protein MotE (MotC chaperone)
MRRHVTGKSVGLGLLLLVLLAAMAACSNDAAEAATVEDFGERPGRADVYARIEGHTDCTALQAEADAARTNLQKDLDARLTAIAESFEQVALDRMEELDCGEDPPAGEQS